MLFNKRTGGVCLLLSSVIVLGSVWAGINGYAIANERYKIMQKQQKELTQSRETLRQLENNIESYKKETSELSDTKKRLEGALQQEQEKTNKLQKDIAGLTKKLSSFNRFKGVRVNAEEITLLEHLVEAEAGIEPMRGKIAVVNCVLNRVMSKYYPNSVKCVICQPLQYETVCNGMIERVPNKDSKEAVKRALAGENYVGDCFSFWAEYLPADNSLWKLPIRYKIGTHVFTNKY